VSIRSARPLLLAAGLIATFQLMGCSTEPLTYSRDFQHQGIDQYNRGEYTDAEGSFTASTKQDPTNYTAQYYLGSCYEITGQFHQAVVAYKLCLNLLTQTPAGRANLALHDQAFDRLASLLGKSDAAGPEIDTLETQATNSNSAEDYRLLARVYTLRGDPDSAIDRYHRALAIAPDDFRLNKEFGLYLASLDQTSQAATVLRRAYHLDSSDKEVLQALQQLGVSQSQLSGATPAATPGMDSVSAPRD
jgi:Tfp pilus assembly protein PilF